MSLPAPRGKKSLPTMLSRTDDFPELYKTGTDKEKVLYITIMEN